MRSARQLPPCFRTSQEGHTTHPIEVPTQDLAVLDWNFDNSGWLGVLSSLPVQVTALFVLELAT
jgi:hypothetical protein